MLQWTIKLTICGCQKHKKKITPNNKKKKVMEIHADAQMYKYFGTAF